MTFILVLKHKNLNPNGSFFRLEESDKHTVLRENIIK